MSQKLKQIQDRYQEKLKTLEPNEPTHNPAHELVKNLQKHHTALNTGYHQIKLLIHPIRRCPRDILYLIFEWAVHIEPWNWLNTAMKISHVCHSWRTLAIHIPMVSHSFLHENRYHQSKAPPKAHTLAYGLHFTAHLHR